MRHFLLLPLLVLTSCASPPAAGPEVALTNLPGGAFKVAVRREVSVGVADPGLMEQGCRRDALRVALEEAERRSWRRPEVDERRIESFSGRVPTPITYCTASLVVSP